MSCCGGLGIRKWDAKEAQWNCSDCGKAMPFEEFFGALPPASTRYTPTKCDCGADKVYGEGNQMHSATMPCALYKKPEVS